MPNNPTITEANLKKIFVNPTVQAAVVDVVIGNRPKGWSRRSNAPYYKEKYALEAKEVIDGMIKDRMDRVYDYAEFESKLNMSRNTVYLRVNQSFAYLVDKMDDIDHTYARFMEMIHIERVRGVGVMIKMIPEFRNSNVSSFVPTQVIPHEQIPQWKEDMLEYLEKGEAGKPFFRDKLALSTEEIEDIKASLYGLKGVIHNITAHSIKIVKTNYTE